jgi:hypothetical protein
MKGYIKLAVYSFSIIIIWGICLLDTGFSNQISVLVGLGITIYSLSIVKKSSTYLNSKFGSILIFVGPTLYLFFAGFFLIPFHLGFFLKSPIVFAFFIFLSTFYISNFSMKTHGVALLFLCYLYTFTVYPLFELEGDSFQKDKNVSELVEYSD